MTKDGNNDKIRGKEKKHCVEIIEHVPAFPVHQLHVISCSSCFAVLLAFFNNPFPKLNRGVDQGCRTRSLWPKVCNTHDRRTTQWSANPLGTGGQFIYPSDRARQSRWPARPSVPNADDQIVVRFARWPRLVWNQGLAVSCGLIINQPGEEHQVVVFDSSLW